MGGSYNMIFKFFLQLGGGEGEGRERAVGCVVALLYVFHVLSVFRTNNCFS